MSLTVARSLRSTVYGGDFGLSNFFYNSEVGGVIDLAPLDTFWRRNLHTFTEDFANAAWTKAHSAITSDAIAGPFAGTFADALIINNAQIPYLFQSGLTIEAGKQYTESIYLKYKDVANVALLFYGTVFDNNSGLNPTTTFNIQNGTIASTTTNSAAIENLGNGWYRCSATHTATATSTSLSYQNCRVISATNGQGVYLFGAQFEQASAVSPYQPITDFHTEVRAMHPAAKLFQDTSGLQPVTSPGQTVALALMKGAREVEARRNLLAYTEEFDEAAWSKGQTTVSINSAVAPDGTSTADLIVEAATDAFHTVSRYTTSVLAQTVITISCHIKAAGRTKVRLQTDAAGGSAVADMDLATGIVASTTNCTATITAIGNGWYRCTFTMTTDADGGAVGLKVILCNTTYSAGYLGDGVSGVYVWGAQLEPGAVATPYQKVITGADGSWTPGQHFVQSSASLRPTYAVRPKGGRRNLLTYTEQFDNAAWAKVDATIAANSAIAPDGTLTADKLAASATTGYHRVEHAASFIASGNYSASIIVKAAELAFVSLTINSGTGFTPNPKRAYFNLSTGTVSIAINGAIASIEDLGGGWYRCSVSAVANATGGSGVIQVGVHNASGDVLTFLGDGVSGVYVWGAQLNIGSTATPYQRVTSMFDVYEAGKTHYGALWFDGVDDFMVSGTVTPETDKVQVFAGVRKNSDAAFASILESSLTSVSNFGTFGLFGPVIAAAPDIGFRSRGSISTATNITSPYPAGASLTVVATGDIPADVGTIRVNAAAAVTSSAEQGTGNFLAYPIYMGRRAGTSLPFSGEIEALIGYRFGPNLSDTQLTQIATFINSRTGAYV